LQKAALLGFVVIAGLTWVVCATGENASNYIAGAPLISLDYLYSHEQWAEKSAWAIYAAGALALIGVLKIWLNRQLHGLFFIFFSIAAVAAISLSAITSDIGAKVVNPGIRPDSKLIKSSKYQEYKQMKKQGGTPKSDNNSLTKPAAASDNTSEPVKNAANETPK
ncbi:MAG: hypothetical protein HQK97_09515, partial [Nitrospirae bacterium]|nr:hypothetical protein [Nitrospirota bacterium]